MGSARWKPALLLGVMLALGAATSGAAQETGSIRGKVREAGSLRPLAGVQISIPGTGRGALSNASGDFLLVGASPGTHTLRAQMIGFQAATQEVDISVGATVQADFALSQAAIEMDALVVTGTPGATQKRTLGNSVSTVQAADVVANAPVSTVTQVLQARTPGLTIMPGSGTVGAASSIRIRGAGSLNAGNQPVFYIDGVRVNAGGQSGFGTSNSTVQPTSALDAVNPEDIESIEVIKGPAAATLYGADAAAGVIQIITKKGRAGQQGIQWSGKAEFGSTEWHLEHPTNYTLCTAAKIGDTRRWPGCTGESEGALLSDNPLERDPTALRTGDVRGYSLSARGGGERYSFYLSGDREDETGVFYNNFYERQSGRANFQMFPVDELDLSFNVGYTSSITRVPNNDNSSNGLLRNAYRGQPGANHPYDYGYRGLSPRFINQYDNQVRAERFVLGTTVNYRPFSWFHNRLTAGLDMNNRLNTLFFQIDTTGVAPFGSDAARGAIYQYSPETHNWTLDYAGTLSHNLRSNLSSAFSAGMQMNAYRFESLQANGVGLTTNQTRLVSSAAETRAFEGYQQQNSVGFFVQEQIGWNDRLFLTGAIRVDDNSAFGRQFSTVVYPKAQVAWVVSEEPFFNVSAMDQLKLRFAWGQAGNSPSPFSADQTYEATVVTLQDGSTGSAITTDAFGNPSLKAETGQEFELGFDASLFENRLGIEATYYNKRTNDALVSIPVAPSAGWGGNRLENLGTIANTGIELSFSGSPVLSPRFSWDSSLGISTNSNELISFGGRSEPIYFGSFSSVQRHQEGFPLAGYWASDVVRDDSGRPVLDLNGRATLEDSASFVGSSTPTREVSLTNTFTMLGGLRFYVFADYKGGYYMWNAMQYVRNRVDQNTLEVNDPQADPADVAARLTLNYTKPYVQRADFVKLREVSVSYDLPGQWLSRVGSERATFTLAGRNLAVWTEYEGADPELNFSNDATFNRADYASVPMMRKLVASLSFSF